MVGMPKFTFKRIALGVFCFVLLFLACSFLLPIFLSQDSSSPERPGNSAPSTKEYLASLPKWERQSIQSTKEAATMNELWNNPGKHIAALMEDRLPGCIDWYGTLHCIPYIIEIEPSEECEWEPTRLVQWEIGEELPEGPQYAGFFGNADVEMVGDFLMTFRRIRLEWFDCWASIGKHPFRAGF